MEEEVVVPTTRRKSDSADAALMTAEAREAGVARAGTLSDDELIYVQRRDNGDAVVHARITRADVVVVACCSVECDLAPATRVLPLQGYVLAAKGGTTQLTWVREADVADASALHAVLAANDARVDRLVARCVK